MKTVLSKFVQTVTVTDPETRLPVELEIRKLETGELVGIDGAWLSRDLDVYSPYHTAVVIDIPDDEFTPTHVPNIEEPKDKNRILRVTKSGDKHLEVWCRENGVVYTREEVNDDNGVLFNYVADYEMNPKAATAAVGELGLYKYAVKARSAE